MNIISRLRLSVQMARVIRLVLIVIVVSPIVAYAAYTGLRPLTNGKINQGYLYGEDPGHKGIDFPASNGIEVKAIANGTVMALRENLNDNSDDPNIPFGNFVLIRHEQRHWVRQNDGQAVGQWGYVYSLYAHLKQNSVVPILNSTVSAGNKIAEVDHTGNSSGPHLHLQIIVHQDMTPQMDSNGIDPHFGWTEPNSRNGELWIAPYNSGSTQTGTAIGFVADSSGNPVGGLTIQGIVKPADATSGTYGWSETYTEANENPDDISVENFATTDVAPGTYHLYANQNTDLGWHTFVAGRTTYIGLYPNYLPDVQNFGTWVSSITVRNNSETRTAKVNTTFFWTTGLVKEQRQDSIAPRASATIPSPTSFIGSALVMGSEDLSVSIATRRSDRAYGGSGMNPGTVGDPAVEYAATTLYAPALYHNAWGYNSTLFIQNTGSATASGTLYLVGRARVGQPDYPSGNCPLSINPGGRIAQTPIACVSSLPSSWVGSARIVSTNNQPLAAQVLGEKSSTADARSFVATATGQTVLHLPAAYKNKWNTNSGVVVQNVGGGNSRIRLTFYDRSTGNQTTTYDFGGLYLTSGQAIGQWLPDLSLLPDGWVGSIKVESLDGQPLAAIAQVADANDVYEYTAATGSFGTTVLLPRAARYDGSKTTGYIVLNPGNSPVTVTPTYYNAAGTVVYTPAPYTLPAHASAGYHQSGDTSLGSGWTGSILLQASGPIVAVMREDDTAALSASAYNGLLR